MDDSFTISPPRLVWWLRRLACNRVGSNPEKDMRVLSGKEIGLSPAMDSSLERKLACLTRREQYNSRHFILEVQPLTSIVQFTRNRFDIHFTLGGVSCPWTSLRSFVVLINRTADHPSNIYRIGHLSATAPSAVHLFQQLSDQHPIRLQKVPSHEDLLGNEVADDLAKAATCNPVDLEDHMVLLSTEIYSRVKELICRTWVGPSCTPMILSKAPWIRHIIQGFQIISNGILTIFDWSSEVHEF
ncbi:RNase H domain-containing protein [Trichonephila clavipes]|nr:RNase H domain-containing protein [Trichonephila clavipes]